MVERRADARAVEPDEASAAPAPKPLRGGRDPGRNRAEAAYTRIRLDIVSGGLRAGDYLNEASLAEQLGMSRTPVREALKQLASDQLVEMIPGRGAWVKDVSLSDLLEIYELRKVLECMAAESAIDTIPIGEIDELERDWLAVRDGYRRGEEAGYEVISRLDNRVHGLLIRHCRNSRLRDFMFLLNQEILRYQLLTARTLADPVATIDQHIELLALLRRRDAQALCEGLRKHLEAAEATLLGKA
jgi:DNA-binding GntR family transcriptional regulator